MEKGLPNNSRGFLGAIKAVTSSPDKKVEPSSTGQIADKVENQIIDRSNSEQESDKKEIRSSGLDSTQTDSRKDSTAAPAGSVDSRIRESELEESEIKIPQSATVEFGQDDTQVKVERNSQQEKNKKSDDVTTPALSATGRQTATQSRLTRLIRDQRKSHSAVANVTSSISPGKPIVERSSSKPEEGDIVLPGNRPALLNQNVDKVLDDLVVGTKDSNYLVEKIRSLVSANLAETPVNEITPPDMSIAGPALDLLIHNSHKPVMLQLVANLISTAMTSSASKFAHPGFVDMLRNITSDEARIIRLLLKIRVVPVIDIKKVIHKSGSYMRLNTLVSTIAADASCEHEDLAETYLANLERLGLLEIPRNIQLTDEKVYDRLLDSPPVSKKLQLLNSGDDRYSGEVVKYYAKLSVYGMQFASACIAHGNGISGADRA